MLKTEIAVGSALHGRHDAGVCEAQAQNPALASSSTAQLDLRGDQPHLRDSADPLVAGAPLGSSVCAGASWSAPKFAEKIGRASLAPMRGGVIGGVMLAWLDLCLEGVGILSAVTCNP